MTSATRGIALRVAIGDVIAIVLNHVVAGGSLIVDICVVVLSIAYAAVTARWRA